MILPLTHENMSVQRLPWITIGIIALNFVVFLAALPRVEREERERLELLHREPASEQEREEIWQKAQELVACGFFESYGFVPARQEWADVVSSMFLHASWMHLLGNMYLLWLCGCNIEDLWGRPLYVVFYLASGALSTLAHAWAFPQSEVPLVGASGAIAGMMGAFLIRLYRTRIRFFYMYWVKWGTFLAPAWVMLPLWLASQIFYALAYGEEVSVAFWAHVGGFVFGALGAGFIKLSLVEEAFLAPAIEQKTTLFAQSPRVAAALGKMETGRHAEAVRDLQAALRDSPDDIDACDLLAQCYAALQKPREKADAHRRKMKIHLRRGEEELALSAYYEMLEADPDLAVPPRELLAVAALLNRAQQWDLAIQAYEKVRASAEDPLLQLKASMALVDIYLEEHRRQKALAVLSSVAPLAERHPEWRAAIEQKLAVLERRRFEH
jgi:membrane associated rhomboid family serine protease